MKKEIVLSLTLSDAFEAERSDEFGRVVVKSRIFDNQHDGEILSEDECLKIADFFTKAAALAAENNS